MKDSIRCCISCILPCGALDVVRIVHASGRVEEISGTVCAADILQAYPKHVLRKPPSSSDGSCPRAIVLPPNAELQRGKIYFLMPASSTDKSARPATRRRRKAVEERSSIVGGGGGGSSGEEDRTRLLLSDRYLSEILSDSKASTQRERRRGRVGVWRPHLESIEEIANDL